MYMLSQLPADVLSEQLKNGVVLMVLGMGIVFAFLALLVLVTKLVSNFVKGGRRAPSSSSAEVDALKQRVKALEAEVKALKAQIPKPENPSRGYGATVPKHSVLSSEDKN